MLGNSIYIGGDTIDIVTRDVPVEVQFVVIHENVELILVELFRRLIQSTTGQIKTGNTYKIELQYDLGTDKRRTLVAGLISWFQAFDPTYSKLTSVNAVCRDNVNGIDYYEIPLINIYPVNISLDRNTEHECGIATIVFNVEIGD